jgi:hypothetical protein
MSKHPLNLLLVFILELAALVAMAYWGWTMHEGLLRVVLAIGVPLLAAAMWGVFRVQNDPKEAPVEVPGWVRLLLEAVFFGSAVVMLYATGKTDWATVFGVLILAHYALAYDRVAKMLRGIPL